MIGAASPGPVTAITAGAGVAITADPNPLPGQVIALGVDPGHDGGIAGSGAPIDINSTDCIDATGPPLVFQAHAVPMMIIPAPTVGNPRHLSIDIASQSDLGQSDVPSHSDGSSR